MRTRQPTGYWGPLAGRGELSYGLATGGHIERFLPAEPRPALAAAARPGGASMVGAAYSVADLPRILPTSTDAPLNPTAGWRLRERAEARAVTQSAGGYQTAPKPLERHSGDPARAEAILDPADLTTAPDKW